ncbi:myo-inositol transporter 1 [Trichomonascus vanleenenianus]|uniref:myo-inositol transporter 1 n=1 Tax=Trichomonascus vanleenenianus TaxID=2268995 RepID=UPI003ECB50D4
MSITKTEMEKNDETHVEDISLASPDSFNDSIEETTPGKYVWLITATVAIGGFLFGFDTGVISGILVVIGNDLGHELTADDKQLITSITSGAAFFGAIIAGMLIDRIGRRPVLGVGAIIFTAGAIIQALSWSLAQMTVGRAVVGLGVGLAAMVVPLYISEVAPARLRGRLVTIDSMCITGGQMIAYIVDIIFQYVHPGGWRYMAGLGALPSLLLFSLVFVIPETPRHLISCEKYEEAERIIRKVYVNATDEQVIQKMQLVEQSFREEHAVNSELSLFKRLKMLYTDKANLRALIVACGLMGIQQFAGSNALMYYSPTIFGMVGFNNPIAVSLVVAATNFIFTGVSLKFIESVGRRNLLLYTMWGTFVCLTIVAVAFHYIPDQGSNGTHKINWAGILVLVFILFYMASYASALGNVAWFGNELFPMEVRSLGTMMVTCTCWGTNVVVSSTFLSLVQATTPSGAFGFYAGICFVGYICIIFLYPEVSGLTLEEVKTVFQHGFGVRYSTKIRKERQQKQKLAKSAKPDPTTV